MSQVEAAFYLEFGDLFIVLLFIEPSISFSRLFVEKFFFQPVVFSLDIFLNFGIFSFQ